MAFTAAKNITVTSIRPILYVYELQIEWQDTDDLIQQYGDLIIRNLSVRDSVHVQSLLDSRPSVVTAKPVQLINHR